MSSHNLHTYTHGVDWKQGGHILLPPNVPLAFASGRPTSTIGVFWGPSGTCTANRWAI